METENDSTAKTPLDLGVASLKERIQRNPWHAGCYLSPQEVDTVRVLLGLEPQGPKFPKT